MVAFLAGLARVSDHSLSFDSPFPFVTLRAKACPERSRRDAFRAKGDRGGEATLRNNQGQQSRCWPWDNRGVPSALPMGGDIFRVPWRLRR